jgi:hypothetical protein
MGERDKKWPHKVTDEDMYIEALKLERLIRKAHENIEPFD